ncbi:hypothetical protein N8873_05010 [Flavobacteriaceae bacterium]|jgi:hypothetical protein|nr:hypothetical protein [Flavobacteriaceae bacterium]MDA8900506.1 hypothetical protein [Flavobacteriaceae bacterium]
MKKGLFAIFLLLLSCYSTERNCLEFHQGTFDFETIVNGQLETSRFVRNGTTEIEYYKAQVDTADIRWVNDCECILTKRNPTSNQDKRPIQIKILTTQKNTYTFEYSLVGDAKNKKRGTIKKIK